jgi:DNA-directed RNA polymerase specialized sigma24 family protein
MSHQDDHRELFDLALSGDKSAQDKLAQIASRRLHEFVYRLTLQEDLTRDIGQEGLVEMIQLFNKAKPIDRFWHWLYGVAYNKVCRHYHYCHHHKALSLSEIDPRRNPISGPRPRINPWPPWLSRSFDRSS